MMFIDADIRSGDRLALHDQEQRPATKKEISDFLKSAQTKAFRMARYRVRNEEAARDIVQDAMIGLVRYCDVHQSPRAAFEPVFYTILRNATFTYFNRTSRRKKWEVLFSELTPDNEDFDDFDFLSVHDSSGQSAMCESVADTLERKQLVAIVEEEIQKLPTNQREVFLMRFEKYSSREEAAQAMGMSIKQTESLLRMAKNRLNAAIRADGTRKRRAYISKEEKSQRMRELEA